MDTYIMPITEELFREALPVKFQTNVTQETLDTVNNILFEPEMAETFKENFITYGHILSQGKYSLESYVSAIKYASYKIAGLTNKDAYIKTFPNRYAQHKAAGTSEKAIESYICAYNKGKLVTSIIEQAYVPVWLLNQDAYQRAINVQVDLMQNADSEKVRSDAANSILNHIKPPENNKVTLDIGLSGAVDTLDQLRETMKNLASLQQKQIVNKTIDVKAIAEGRIIEHKESDEDE